MRIPYQEHHSPTPFAGTVRHTRFTDGADLVGGAEARSRLGVGSSTAIGSLGRRAVVAGEREWLVDLTCLATAIEDPAEALAREGGLVVIERGESL